MAAFLDRDGTVIAEREYLADPAGVELLPGALGALRRLQQGGLALVLISNQSGIARGYFTPAALEAVQQRLTALLAEGDVRLDATYFCPHHPDHTGPCDCRKPGTALFRQAAVDLDLDLGRCAFIGDRLSDVTPAAAFGGRGYLVRTGYGGVEAALAPPEVMVVADLPEAAARILQG